MRVRLFCLQTHIEQTLGAVSVQPEREQQPAQRGDTRRAERDREGQSLQECTAAKP